MSDDESLRDTANSNGYQPAAPPAQQLTDPLDNWPRLPDGITIANGINLHAPDPTYVPEPVNAGPDKHAHRRCIATRQDGNRCATRAMHHHLVCPQHGGRMRAEDGARAKWTRRKERERRAEQALQLQRLGTRAVVAEALVAEAEKVDRAVRHLVDAAANGDIAAAKALIPWLDQALGKPTERHELRVPSSVEELEQLSEAELERLVAQGRARRLALRPVPEPARDWRRRDPPLGVADGDVVADD